MVPISTKLPIKREGFIRVVADIVLVNAALMGALVIRFFNLAVQKGSFEQVDVQEACLSYAAMYQHNAWVLTLIGLIVFTASGFYTYGRAYRGRFKALVVSQAVTVTYFAYGAFLFGVNWSHALTFRVWLVAWLLTVGVMVTARLWASLWANVIYTEGTIREVADARKVDRVLVIGGAGYVGSALLPKLLEKGYKIRLLDLMVYGTEPIQDVVDHPNLEIIEADFRQVDQVVKASRGVDAVVHLGGIVGDPACALDEDLTIEVNLMATRMVAEVAKGCGVRRFVFASSCSVYGASDEMLDEHSFLNPVSLYARSKIASEKVLTKMVDRDFAPTCLRFGTIYGLSGRTRFDLVVNLLSAKAAIEEKITLYGGDQWRPFLHVDDAALSIVKCLEARPDVVRGEIFNVGSSAQNFTLQEVAELIKAQAPRAEIMELGQDSDRRNYRVNFDKIAQVLGFVPQWTVEKGIAQVLEAIAEGKVKDYRRSEYSNVKILSEEAGSRLIRREQLWVEELLLETLPKQPIAS